MTWGTSLFVKKQALQGQKSSTWWELMCHYWSSNWEELLIRFRRALVLPDNQPTPPPQFTYLVVELQPIGADGADYWTYNSSISRGQYFISLYFTGKAMVYFRTKEVVSLFNFFQQIVRDVLDEEQCSCYLSPLPTLFVPRYTLFFSSSLKSYLSFKDIPWIRQSLWEA